MKRRRRLSARGSLKNRERTPPLSLTALDERKPSERRNKVLNLPGSKSSSKSLQRTVPSLRDDLSAANARADAERAAREKAGARAVLLQNVLAGVSIVLIAGASAALLATHTVHGTVGASALVVVATLAGYLAVRVLSQNLAKELVVILTVVVAAVTVATALVSHESSRSSETGSGHHSTAK